MDLGKETIEIVQKEVDSWSDTLTWVTDRVAFRVRDLLRTLRKNYWGVFDNPIDPTTGRKKIWIPLTQSLCDAVTKNIKTKPSSFSTKAKREAGIPFSILIRAMIRNFLRSIFFNEHLEQGARQLAIDGTVVWKTVEINGRPVKSTVDLLNVYIDPTADSIQSAFRFTERALLTVAEMKSMTGWTNLDDLKPTSSLSKRDKDAFGKTDLNTAQLLDVYEMWGQIPLRLITGKKDDDELVDGHIVVSGLESNDKRWHLIEKNTTKDSTGQIIKPYEEAWYIKDQGRWYGIGIAEKVVMLQLWLNTIVNIRINRSYVSQLGLYLIRRGSGITPQMLSRLGSNGAIQVQNMDDVQQLVMQEASQASYTDEARIIDWAQRVTSAFESVTGESVAPSTTATAIATQAQSAGSQFSMVKDGFTSFLERWLDRHIVPILAKNLKAQDVVRALGEDLIEEIGNLVAFSAASDELDTMFKRGEVPSKQDLLNFIDETKNDFISKPEVFIENIKDIITDSVETEVSFSDNENIQVTTGNLINMANVLGATRPDLVEPIVRRTFDLLGMDFPKAESQPQLQPTDPQALLNQPQLGSQLNAETLGNAQNVPAR